MYTTGITMGPQNPINAIEIGKKSTNEVAGFLTNWIPTSHDFTGETYNGMGRILEQDVANRYNEYITNLEKFKINNFAYNRSVIFGFEKTLTKDSQYDWDKVISYLIWSVTDDVTREGDEDSNLSEVRRAVCRLLEKGLASKENAIPLQLREQCWSIINTCLTDSDPTIARENNVNENDYYHVAINSTRGVSLECAISYGHWVMRLSSISADESNAAYYEELFLILEKHLNLENDRSIAVHTIYGRWFPYIAVLDKRWAKKISMLFFRKKPL